MGDSTSSSDSEQKRGKWTSAEDERLRLAVLEHGDKRWKQISDQLGNRTPIQCLHRWTKILRPGLVKGPWSTQEDELVVEWVRTRGPNRWSLCAQRIAGRSGKQCRERWSNALNPELKKGGWSTAEDDILFRLYKLKGAKWTEIAKSLPGRSENSIKNRFYSTLRRVRPRTVSQEEPCFVEEPVESLSLEEQVQKLLHQLTYMEEILKETYQKIETLEKSIEEEERAEEMHASSQPTDCFSEIYCEDI